jgi:peptidoglycan/xylan/chitin deacetylase (PgdA/CDA1 family)
LLRAIVIVKIFHLDSTVARPCAHGASRGGGSSLAYQKGTVGTRLSLDGVLRWSPAQLAFLRRAASRLTVLAYHGVDDPETLGRQLDHLTRTMHPVSLDEVAEAAARRRELPPRAVLITFDDGHRSLLKEGLPLLRERGLPAVAFVIAGLLGTDQPFWWTEVEALLERGGRAGRHAGLEPAALVARLKTVPDAERLEVIDGLRRTARQPAPRTGQLRLHELPALERAGVAVENHSLTHPCLPNCRDGKVHAEVLEAHRRLRQALGREPRAFAYPNGDWDERAERALREAGYALGFLFDHHPNPPVPPHPLRVSRFRVNSDTTLDRFALILSGLHSALHHARGRR